MQGKGLVLCLPVAKRYDYIEVAAQLTVVCGGLWPKAAKQS